MRFSVLLICCVVSRVVFSLVNPAENSYDDYMEAIALYNTNLTIPDVDQCWQCYQPPFFMGVSTLIIRSSLALNIDADFVWELALPAW